RAVGLRAQCADAQLALAEALAAAARHPDAAAPLKRALALEPELAPRAVPLLCSATFEVRAFLDEQIRTHVGPAPYELALALWLKSKGKAGSEEAIAILKRLVDRRPQFWEARRELGTLLLAHDRSEELRADYQDILGTLGQPYAGFICAQCQQRLPELLF